MYSQMAENLDQWKVLWALETSPSDEAEDRESSCYDGLRIVYWIGHCKEGSRCCQDQGSLSVLVMRRSVATSCCQDQALELETRVL